MMLRFRLRNMMVIVMLIGLALEVVSQVQRRAETFRELTKYHWWAAFRLRSEALGIYDIIGAHHHGFDEEKLCRELGPWNLAAYHASKYHEALLVEYRGASSHPWLPVAPDPPTPPFCDWVRPVGTNPANWRDPYDSNE
jgi:hypothetical protein